MRKLKCKVCGEVFEAAGGIDPICPRCGARNENVELIEEAQSNTKYAGTQTGCVPGASGDTVPIGQNGGGTPRSLFVFTALFAVRCVIC